jgi:peptidoglycan/LPS O-acetylase OafA/YrhL
MPTNTPSRRNDLDWLRVLAVLLLVPFHAALIFVQDPNSIMYVKDTRNSEFLAIMAGFIHQFHMPLLFAISGAATGLALGVRGPGQYLRERALRLLVPLLFAIFVLIPPMTYLTRLVYGTPLGFWEHYLGFFRLDPNDLSGYGGTLTPAHAWFILYLLIFSLVALPGFLWARRADHQPLMARVAALLEKRLALFWLVIPLALTAAIDVLGDKNPFYYFTVFCLGYLLITDPRYTDALDRDAPISLAMGLLFAVLRQVWQPHFAVWSLPWIGYGLMEQATRWFLVLALLGWGHRWLQRGGKVLRYLSEAAFPFYILHLPITTLVGYFVIRLEAPIAFNYLLIVTLSILLTFGVYELAKRVAVLRFLLGMKKRRVV